MGLQLPGGGPAIIPTQPQVVVDPQNQIGLSRLHDVELFKLAYREWGGPRPEVTFEDVAREVLDRFTEFGEVVTAWAEARKSQ